ncbi:MAG: hypothetical protein E6G19_10375 [Actinobacteria bacterium]|nr:MAG: hypothetical protein E6G19_10375 [Actinomycetota bacterium]
MTRDPDFNELVGQDAPAEERERLRRAHDLLLAAGPIPELPPGLEEPSLGNRPGRLNENAYQLLPRRRTGAALALAAAIALVAFVGGYAAGFRHNGFAAQYSVPLHSTSGRAASAEIEIGKRDSQGNWPLRVEAKGLPKLMHGYYEMYLTHGGHKWTCGTFAGGGPSTVKVRLTVPYSFRNGDGWIVTKQLPGHAEPGPVVLTT